MIRVLNAVLLKLVLEYTAKTDETVPISSLTWAHLSVILLSSCCCHLHYWVGIQQNVQIDMWAHQRLCSLIRVFDKHSMGSQGFNVSSGWKLRLSLFWSDCGDAQTDLNLRCNYMYKQFVPLIMLDTSSIISYDNPTKLGPIELAPLQF